MKHIIIVSRGIPTDKCPMNGIFEWDQAKALSQAGIKVSFVVADFRSIRHKRPLKTKIYQHEGINVIHGNLPLGSLPTSFFFHIGKYKILQLVKKAINSFGKPDLLHGHFIDIGAMSAFAANALNVPIVITEHSSSVNKDSLLHKTLYFGKKAYYNANKIIAVSEQLRRRLKEHFNVDSIVIPNMVDTNSIAFALSKRAEHKNNEKFLFVSTGSLLSLKGHDLLVSSFAKIPCGKAELKIIGRGPEEKNLKALISKLEVGDRVSLLGLKNRKEISKIYEKSDCFVLASRSETFGVVYIEAMLAGLPVIATRCGGPDDFVNPDNGILVDVDNQEQLTNALLTMIENYRTYSPERIHEYAIEKFSPNAISNQLVKLYNEIIKNAK